MAVGYETKANPVPAFTTLLISSALVSYCRFPKILNIVQPAKNDVPVSAKLIIQASLKRKNNAISEK